VCVKIPYFASCTALSLLFIYVTDKYKSTNTVAPAAVKARGKSESQTLSTDGKLS